MTASMNRGAIGWAAGLALSMHLLLFMAVRPSDGSGRADHPASPGTCYLSKFPTLGNNIRTIGSPVLFSIPSKMGFSHELLKTDLRTRLTFSQRVESDNFLEVDPAAHNSAAQFVPQELMLTAGGAAGPRVPEAAFQTLGKPRPGRRVHIDPELKARLVGGVVLPPALNKETETTWQVRADVDISEQGVVRHVFLDQPVESASLNQQVLQLLYGLRFKPGDGSVEGCIEIYSPEKSAPGGATP